mgnify:CR=1 FL=1
MSQDKRRNLKWIGFKINKSDLHAQIEKLL